MSMILNVKEIKSLLPYKYPMLMLDRVLLENEKKATAIKNLSINELFFQGHFPNHAIMPGVLQVEAMKQLSEILVAPQLNPNKTSHIYLRLAEKVKFRNPNNPGDRMKVESELLNMENGEACFQCRTSNASGVTCEAKLTLALRDKTLPSEMPDLFNEFDKSPDIAMNTEAIQKLIPHRYPFLLVDNLIKVEGDQVITTKNVTANEEILQGMSPDYMVLSESLQCEMVAQAGCACVLSRPENHGKIGYFMTIDRAESFAPIYPGDQVVCDLILPPAKSRFGKGTGVLKVGGKTVFTITLMFAIVEP